MVTCYRCGQSLSAVKGEQTQINTVGGGSLPGFSLACPVCQCLFGITIDPIWLEKRLVKRMRQGLESQ